MLTDDEITYLWAWATAQNQGSETTQQHAFARFIEREAYRRAAQECRVTCGKNHADAATFKSGTKAYVQGCDDCAAAIEALRIEWCPKHWGEKND